MSETEPEMTQLPEQAACDGDAGRSRCDADLPDAPACAVNFHFGMLLGVEDFRAEQGFHVGRLRRHQRLAHGHGVVAGFPVDFDAEAHDLRVGPGYALDALGRDLEATRAQCINLVKWWRKHQDDAAFDDIVNPRDARLDLDVLACHATCLARPVPAIAEPCARDAADIAHARVCETVSLWLARAEAAPSAPVVPHLLRLWLGQAAPAVDGDGQLRADDAWLKQAIETLLALPAAQQDAARAELAREVWARALAGDSPAAPEARPGARALCVPLARLTGVHFIEDADGWRVGVDRVAYAIRPLLPSTGLLRDLLLSGVSGLEAEGLDLTTLFNGS